jgi:hypothetical protein
MDTQGLQLDAPETHATQQVRSKKMVPLIAGAAVMVILAAIGVYYVAFRSLPTTVSWAPSVSAVAPGGDLTVSGRVTPAENGRLVSFESAPKAQGPWQPMPQSATTNSRGQFSLTYKPQLNGSIVMRVVVDPAGRYLAVTGKSMPVQLLTLSSISLKGGGATATQTPIKFTVAVDPPGVGRTVRIEQSSDKVRWVLVGPSATTKTDGTSVVSVPGPAVGVWSYRASVAQDDKFTAAVSPAVGATVENIKAAAVATSVVPQRANSAPAPVQNTLPAPVQNTLPAPVQNTLAAPVQKAPPAPTQAQAPVKTCTPDPNYYYRKEQTRISREAQMSNLNIQFNMALNSGDLDKAAMIQNNMIALQQQWAVEDSMNPPPAC